METGASDSSDATRRAWPLWGALACAIVFPVNLILIGWWALLPVPLTAASLMVLRLLHPRRWFRSMSVGCLVAAAPLFSVLLAQQAQLHLRLDSDKPAEAIFLLLLSLSSAPTAEPLAYVLLGMCTLFGILAWSLEKNVPPESSVPPGLLVGTLVLWSYVTTTCAAYWRTSHPIEPPPHRHETVDVSTMPSADKLRELLISQTTPVWQPAAGGVDSYSGFAFKLSYVFDDVTRTDTAGETQYVVSLRYEMAVRKRLRVAFANPLVEAKTPGDRRAAVRLVASKSMDGSMELRLDGVDLIDPPVLKLNVASFVEMSFDAQIADGLGTLILSQCRGAFK